MCLGKHGPHTGTGGGWNARPDTSSHHGDARTDTRTSSWCDTWTDSGADACPDKRVNCDSGTNTRTDFLAGCQSRLSRLW